jgi:hypothetical protein
MHRSLCLRASLRRHATVIALFLSLCLLMPAPVRAQDLTSGDYGSGPVNRQQSGVPGPRRFGDINDSSLAWAAPAIRYVAEDRHWMDDFGDEKFRPNVDESRALFARALVKAFAPDATPDPNLEFTDLKRADPSWEFANIAVSRGWLQRNKDGEFEPTEPVTMIQVHFALVTALPLAREVRGLANIHDSGGYAFQHPAKFPQILLGMRLHSRYNHPNEGSDVTPRDALSRAEVAYSLWRAATTDRFDLYAVEAYQDIELPPVDPDKRRFIEFGMRYIGYPYVWGGDWYEKSPSGYCCGAQPQGGFDCSGLMWWNLKAPGDGYNNRKIRGYRGWDLPQRSSSAMAAAGKRLDYQESKPGDLMFYDGDGNGGIDHVDVYLGNGWALDSSSGQGGVTILRVGEGWYRDHFVHGRRIIKG